ncbi:MAG: hypothetical protein H7Y04_06515, partial [Verrucomicrobia bacterium]|nr:hypothetical protein [Cytophagales bacterium]
LTWGNQTLKPATFLTCLANRHYVRKDLKITLENTAKLMNQRFPDTKILYLDANFPFFDSFPLLPHLSHNDGRKLDLSFYYKNKQTQKNTNFSPSFIGYGFCEEPTKNEQNMPEYCKKQGFWQYGLLRKITPQTQKNTLVFDAEKTKILLQLLTKNPAISLIFIEPHLKFRLGFGRNPKIGFHGCHAVRHDDHIHIASPNPSEGGESD